LKLFKSSMITDWSLPDVVDIICVAQAVFACATPGT
jgi:hypothetical protein